MCIEQNTKIKANCKYYTSGMKLSAFLKQGFHLQPSGQTDLKKHYGYEENVFLMTVVLPKIA